MTRAEYETQYESIDKDDNDDSGSISMYARRAHASNMRVMVCQDYISSLEAENAKLTKAIDKAAKRIAKEQVCPNGKAFYKDECDNNCHKCWLNWLMNNNQNKGDKDE